MNLNDRLNQLYGSGYSYDSSGNLLGGVSTGATGIFGTFSKEDEARMSLDMSRAQTLADLEVMKYQNEYNSPANQAKLMRQAGLNPDLLGIDGVAESADFASSGGSAPQGSNSTDVVSNVIGTAFNAFNMASNVVSGLMSFKSAQEELSGRRIDNMLKMDSFALDYLLGSISPASFNTDGSLYEDQATSLISSARSFAKNTYGWNRKDSRRFENSVVRALQNPRFVQNFYSALNSGETQRQSYLSQTSGDLYDMQDSAMRILLDSLIKEKNRFMKSSYSYQANMNNYQSDVYDSLDPLSFAERQNIDSVNQTSQIRNEFYEKSFYRDVNKRLYKDYKNGNIFSGILLTLMGSASDIGNTAVKAVGKLL